MLIFFVFFVEGTDLLHKLIEVTDCPDGRSHSGFDRSVRIHGLYEWETVYDFVAFHLVYLRIPVKQNFGPIKLWSNDARFHGLHWFRWLGNQNLRLFFLNLF